MAEEEPTSRRPHRRKLLLPITRHRKMGPARPVLSATSRGRQRTMWTKQDTDREITKGHPGEQETVAAACTDMGNMACFDLNHYSENGMKHMRGYTLSVPASMASRTFSRSNPGASGSVTTRKMNRGVWQDG